VHGTLVAASTLGAGRVVAFAGQDFLSSGDRSTLLGHAGTTQLLANAARWVRQAGDGRILVDNEAVRAALQARGITDVDVVASHGDVREWAVDLSAYAAIPVQINEGGPARVAPAGLGPSPAGCGGARPTRRRPSRPAAPRSPAWQPLRARRRV